MIEIKPIKNKRAKFDAPPAKAYTLRTLLMSALAEGKSIIHNPLLAQDQLHLIDCLKGLGVQMEQVNKANNTEIHIQGCSGKLKPVCDEISVGESGVGMNFLASVANIADKPITITGKPGLLARPIAEVINGMRQLGSDIEYIDKEGYPPIRIKGGGFKGGKAKISGSKNSQYFSSITVASPFAEQDVNLVCSDTMTERPYYDITINMMSDFGIKVVNNDYQTMIIKKGQKYKARETFIEGDFSSASFFFLAALICRSSVIVGNLNRSSLQGDSKFLDLVKEMGCEITWDQNKVTVTGKKITAIKTNMKDIPDLVPPIAIAAAFAEGPSVFSGVGHLRYKECNRLDAIVNGLKKMGGNAYYDEDNLYIDGGKKLKGTEIDPYNDHRIAMSFGIAGLVSDGQIILDEKCVAKSFPDFWQKITEFY